MPVKLSTVKLVNKKNEAIVYIYNATGQKLEKTVKETSGITHTDYLTGFQYKYSEGQSDQGGGDQGGGDEGGGDPPTPEDPNDPKNPPIYTPDPVKDPPAEANRFSAFAAQAAPSRPTLQFFPTAEGYYDYISKKYVYQYKDHLGNVRVSYAKNPVTQVLEIIEENNYYPFGLKHTGYNDYVASNNKYKFQGQERQDELGLNWDSFKYRNYDYTIGRFMSIDPLSEKYQYQSPYNFSENRVVDSRELEGLEKVSIHLLGNLSTGSSNSSTQIVGSINLDMGNRNKLTYSLSVGGIGTIKGAYTDKGHKYTISGNDKKQNAEDAWASTMAKGVKIPDWLAKFGIGEAKESMTPEDAEEALSMSKDEVETNSTASYILNSAYDLIDNDSMDAYWSYDGSQSQGTNSKGEKYLRKFTHTYSGKFQNFRFSYKGYTFTGNMVVDYTEQEEVKKEEEKKK